MPNVLKRKPTGRKKNGMPLGISTQRGRLGTLRDFFSWMTKQNLIPANPASELEMPRQKKRLPREALGIQQIAAVINIPDIGRPGSCHLIRATCAIHMLEGGADIRFIQQLLGHDNRVGYPLLAITGSD